MNAEIEVDDLVRFEAHGADPLTAADIEGWPDHDGARIWHASYGDGPPVVLLHGGLGHAGNWGYQVPAILIDSRGHGRSTRDDRPYSYERMASDVLAVIDALGIDSARFVGWSDGACIALVLAARAPTRAAGVFFFACNMDPGGTKVMEPSPVIDRCFARQRKDYASLLLACPDLGGCCLRRPDHQGRCRKSRPSAATSGLLAGLSDRTVNYRIGSVPILLDRGPCRSHPRCDRNPGRPCPGRPGAQRQADDRRRRR
jgi:pimeloyl-ACP methyl ester carboxylesterase